MYRAIGFLSALALCGCATNQIQTASGSPEVTVSGARPDQVKPALINAVLNARLRIKSDTQYSLVVEKPTENLGATILFATAYGAPTERITFVITEVPGGTRIVADATMISNAGSAFERSTLGPQSGNNAELQSFLNGVAASAARARPSSAPPVAANRRQDVQGSSK